MAWAIYRDTYLLPTWGRLGEYTPGFWSRLWNGTSPNRTWPMFDLQENVNAWKSRFGLKDIPIGIDRIKVDSRVVSECFESRDMCSLAFDARMDKDACLGSDGSYLEDIGSINPVGYAPGQLEWFCEKTVAKVHYRIRIGQVDNDKDA